jgi:two-component system sensor histidine kinase BaeS
MKTRLTWAFIGVASGMVFLATIILIIETHYHFSLYRNEFPQAYPGLVNLYFHFEQALIQSALLTALGTILFAVFVSVYMAKRIAAPLIAMRKVAEEITQGKWNSRVSVEGKDELADLGRALNHLTEELQKQEEYRKNLTSDIAHELRTPLATLKSHFEAMKDGIWKPTPERIHSCYEEIERLIHLVGDLEQLQGVESPGFKLQRKNENIVEIVQQSIKAMETAYYQKEVDLINDAKGEVIAFVDRYRMTQIIMNLLSNALKFTPPGGHVTVKVKDKSDHVLLIVEDTGIGIPSEEIPKVFERFYRVDKSRSRKPGGSGIGLTIAKKLVEAHQGSVCLKSKEGKGTTVYVSIPKKPG